MIRLLLVVGCLLLCVGSGSRLCAQEPTATVLNRCGCTKFMADMQAKRFGSLSAARLSLTEMQSAFQMKHLPQSAFTELFEPLRNAAKADQRALAATFTQIDGRLKTLLSSEKKLLQQWESNAQIVRSTLQKAGSRGAPTVEASALYTLCAAIQASQDYYQLHPASNSNGSSDPSNANSQTNANPSTQTPVSMLLTILIAVGASLVSMIIAIVVARAGKSQPSATPEELGKLVLQSPQVAQALQNIRQSLSNDIDTAIQSQTQALAASFAAEIKGMVDKEMSTHVGSLQQQVQRIPIIDTAAIERILNDLNTRTTQLERAPKTKYEIHYSAQELSEFIQKNQQLQEALREVLNINKLQATVLEKIPSALQLPDLDALQKIAADFYWKNFSLNPNYLPAFKNQLIRDVEREVIRVLQNRR